MIYQTYQAYEDSSRPLRMYSGAIVAALGMRPGIWGNEILSRISATHELLALAGLSHKAPKFGIASIKLMGSMGAIGYLDDSRASEQEHAADTSRLPPLPREGEGVGR